MRYGLVFILLLFGLCKFTATEAEAIKPLVDNSPLLAWMNHLFPVRTTAGILGTIEIITALLIGLRFVSSKMSFYGSIMGILIFSITLSFIFTTPGYMTKVEWIWMPDGFVFKDLLLLGFCFYSAAESHHNPDVDEPSDIDMLQEPSRK